jgi:hypothetical protein
VTAVRLTTRMARSYRRIRPRRDVAPDAGACRDTVRIVLFETGVNTRTAWNWIGIGGGALIVLALLARASLVPFESDALRQRLVQSLAERFDSDVELAALSVRLLPTLHVEGSGLTVRHRGRRDVRPLVSVSRFAVDSGILALLHKHVAQVSLDGLDIEIPPEDDETADEPDARPSADRRPPGFIIGDLVSVNARLVIIPSSRDRPPKEWKIHRLHMSNVGFEQMMRFEAVLTNALPPGEIETKGTFGPWNSHAPGRTPLGGTFTFDAADLAVFKGIGGILSAHGEFGGELGRIKVHGETDTPDFRTAIAGHAVSLHTMYVALIDGTNGDTRLERINASFLDTSLVASGSVVGRVGQKGRTMTLDLTMDHATLQDLLLLVVKAPRPPLTGRLKLTTRFVLVPGEGDVISRLHLDGNFSVIAARFTSPEVESRIAELSRRSRGDPQVEESPRRGVSSDLAGKFRLEGGTLSLPGVTFQVPGASVHLAGTYALRPETLDFRGELLMDAKLSETQRGLKRLLLKAIDPLFRRKGGGSEIPIKVTGTRSDPKFGVDPGRIFSRG